MGRAIERGGACWCEGGGGAVGAGLGGRAEAALFMRAFVTYDTGANAASVLCCRGVQSTAVLYAPVVLGAATCNVLNNELGWSLRPSQTPSQPYKWGWEGSDPSRTLPRSTSGEAVRQEALEDEQMGARCASEIGVRGWLEPSQMYRLA